MDGAIILNNSFSAIRPILPVTRETPVHYYLGRYLFLVLFVHLCVSWSPPTIMVTYPEIGPLPRSTIFQEACIRVTRPRSLIIRFASSFHIKGQSFPLTIHEIDGCASITACLLLFCSFTEISTL